MSDSPTVEVIKLVKAAFSSAQDEFGLIKFSIEEVVPVTNPDGSQSNLLWEVTCSFFEALSNPNPSKYKAVVNLSDKTVRIKKIGGGEIERKFTVSEESVAPSEAGGVVPGSSIEGSTPPPPIN